MKLRLAQKGWNGATYAETAEDCQAGVDLCWVELVDDRGRVQFRTDAVAGAELGRITDEFLTVTVEFIAAVELVYVGRDGRELDHMRVTDPVRQMPVRLEHGTEMRRRGPRLVDWDRARQIAQRMVNRVKAAAA
jgi:hypothetical protein